MAKPNSSISQYLTFLNCYQDVKNQGKESKQAQFTFDTDGNYADQCNKEMNMKYLLIISKQKNLAPLFHRLYRILKSLNIPDTSKSSMRSILNSTFKLSHISILFSW